MRLEAEQLDNPMITLDSLFAATMTKAVQTVAKQVEAQIDAKYTERPINAQELKRRLATGTDKTINETVYQEKLAQVMPFHTKGKTGKDFYWSEVVQWEHTQAKHYGGY